VQQQIAGDFEEKNPKKKIPKISPYCWLVMASSLFIVSAANPMLTRSRRATMKSRKIKGRILVRSLRMVLASLQPYTAEMTSFEGNQDRLLGIVPGSRALPANLRPFSRL
jgi:hypothetical protein